MNQQTQIQQFRNWYSRADVQFEIIKFTKDREFAVIYPKYWNENPGICTRLLKCHNTNHFKFIMGSMLKMFEKPAVCNLYTSLAKFEGGIPHQPSSLKDRDNSDWNKNYWKYISDVDCLIDIDSPDHSPENIDYAYRSAKAIKLIFDNINMPYELRFSGCGFHFIIKGEFFTFDDISFNPYEDGSIFEFYSYMSKWLYRKVSEMVDYKINDSRRICKIPYSLSFYKEATYVCVPFLNNIQFETFKLEDMSFDLWKGRSIKGKGSYVFNGHGLVHFKNFYEVIENVKKSNE